MPSRPHRPRVTLRTSRERAATTKQYPEQVGETPTETLEIIMSRIALMSAVAFVAILGAASLAAADTLNKNPSSNGQPQCNTQAGKPAPTAAQCHNQGSKWVSADPIAVESACRQACRHPNAIADLQSDLGPVKIQPGNAAPIKPLVTNNPLQPANPPNKGWTSATPSEASPHLRP